mgnify:CR=1 FL=1
MSIRKELAEMARVLKDESGYTYTTMSSMSGLTRKQLSSIFKGELGISIEKIETFFLEVFNNKVGVYSEDINLSTGDNNEE